MNLMSNHESVKAKSSKAFCCLHLIIVMIRCYTSSASSFHDQYCDVEREKSHSIAVRKILMFLFSNLINLFSQDISRARDSIIPVLEIDEQVNFIRVNP